MKSVNCVEIWVVKCYNYITVGIQPTQYGFKERSNTKMDIYRVALFGHRDFCVTREIENKLYSILRDLMQTKLYLEIYIGRNGEFDIFAASIVKRIKKEQKQ